MKETRLLMGMPVTVHVVGAPTPGIIGRVFAYFEYVDRTFSTYKDASEISAINRGELAPDAGSDDMRTIFALAEDTKRETNGYFDIRTPTGDYDPSGIVKGWAIRNAAELIAREGYRDFYVDAGGDIQTGGVRADGTPWRVGIRNPFSPDQIVKIVALRGEGIATSGTYIRGDHIYNPKDGSAANAIASLTVVGKNIHDADRFATGAFAMGEEGIRFIEGLPGFEGYMIDHNGTATMTSGFARYLAHDYAA